MALTQADFDAAWRANSGYLTDLAYRMLGDLGASEDIVQEAFLKLSHSAPDVLRDVRGWLTVVTSRLCLDHLRSAPARRERTADDVARSSDAAPVASEAPPNPADRITLADDVRLALLVMLQRLMPAERVAFVLHDVFGVPFDDIATTLGKPANTCRQLARRARLKISGDPLRDREVREAEHREVTERFIAACAAGDVEKLVDVLHPDVWGLAEFLTGTIEPQSAYGPENVSANLLLFFGEQSTLVSHPVAGTPTLVAYAGRRAYGLLTLTIEEDRVIKIEALVDPQSWQAEPPT